MEYRPFKDGIKTSLLGMGNMRLPTVEGDPNTFDYEESEKIIDKAYASGINYFDTAYIYKNSEEVLGRALSKYPRDSYYIATKLPGMRLKSADEIDMYFNEEMERLGVDYIDFYLCHGLKANNYDQYVGFDVYDALCRKREEGKIKYLGFSSHAEPELLEKFASMYKWDFAQIQLNYFDWDYQDAKGQYEILTKLGIPVIVMEPVRGGRLVNLTPEADALLREARPDMRIPSWAIRFAASLPNVQVVLSGMSNFEQIEDNVKTMTNFEPLSDSERELLDKCCNMLKKTMIVPCTRCRYCCEGCPVGIDIPKAITVYNDLMMEKDLWHLPRVFKVAREELSRMPEGSRPEDCVNCGQCSDICPQHIDVPGILSELTDILK